MKSLIAFSVLVFTVTPAMANGEFNPVPEPGVLALFAATAVAFAIARRLKK